MKTKNMGFDDLRGVGKKGAPSKMADLKNTKCW